LTHKTHDNNDNKEIIRRASITVIAENGFYNTRMARIAEEAGVAVGTLYNYFSSKEDLLEYIFEVEFEKRLQWLDTLNQEDLDFASRLQGFLSRHFHRIRENPNLGKILVREKDFPRQGRGESIGGYLYEIPSTLEEMLQEAAENGEIEIVDVKLAAAMIFGAIQGIVERVVVKGEPLELLEKAPRQFREICENGLST